MVLSKFVMNTWYFKNDKCLEIEKRLQNEDAEIFRIKELLEHSIRNRIEYGRDCQKGVERYILNIETDMEKNLKRFQR